MAAAVLAVRVLGTGAEVWPQVPAGVVRAEHGVDTLSVDDTETVSSLASLYLAGTVVRNCLVRDGSLIAPLAHLDLLHPLVQPVPDRQGLARSQRGLAVGVAGRRRRVPDRRSCLVDVRVCVTDIARVEVGRVSLGSVVIVMIAIVDVRDVVVVRRHVAGGVIVDGQVPIVHLVVVEVEVARLRNANADASWLLLEPTRVVAGIVLGVILRVVPGVVTSIVLLRCSS